MSKLVEKRNELDAKRQKVGKVFKEAGDDLDFSKVESIKGETTKEKVKNLRALESELNDLQQEVDDLAAVENGKKQFDQYRHDAGDENQKGEEPKKQKSIGEMFTDSDAY